MNRRKFLNRFLIGGLLIPGCVKEIADSQLQRDTSSQLQKYFSLVVYTDVKSKEISSARIYAPIDKAKSILEENGFEIISLEENAFLRVLGDKDAIVSRFGNFTREGFVYMPNKEVYLVKHSPVLDSPDIAADAHRNGREFYIDNVEKALEDSVQIPYDLEPIPTNKFSEDEIITFAFGDDAGVYGMFLRDSGIAEMPIHLVVESYVGEQERPFVRQSWLSRLKCRYGICGNFEYLGMCPRVRGIRYG